MEERRIYCLVPHDLATRLHDALRRHFIDDPNVEVVVEHRGHERRTAGERRSGSGADASGGGRRRIRGIGGRRVAERRAPLVSLSAEEAPTLPRRARRFEDRIAFVERVSPSSEALEDADTARLVGRFQAGEPEVFADLYMRYFDRVYGYLRALLRDRHEAEDLTQQAFVEVLEALKSYERRRQPFRGWLFVVVRNVAVSHMRKQGRIELTDPHAEHGQAQVVEDDLFALAWLADRDLQVLVERLPPIQRQVLLLRYLLDLPSTEVARILDRSPVQIRKLQHRALAFLRERLTALGRAPERRGSIDPWRRRITQVRVLRDRRFALLR